MRFFSSTALIAVPIFFGGVTTALGINCRGSGMCSFVHCGGRTCIGQLSELVVQLPDNATYAPGAHILCSPKQKFGDGICLFTERFGPATGAQVKAAYAYIMRWGCQKCGSAPFDPAGNDVGKGSLTVNVVHKPNCKGICPPPSSSSSSSSLSSMSSSTRIPLSTAPAPDPNYPVGTS